MGVTDEDRWFTFFDLAEGHASARYTLLDVRDHDEWLRGHFSGSENVPLGQLKGFRRRIPRRSSFIVIGSDSRETEEAAELLESWGHSALAPPGGYRDVQRRCNWTTSV
jgi:rhodanese-related sulfurtransferase